MKTKVKIDDSEFILKITWIHIRNKQFNESVSPTGGETECIIKDGELDSIVLTKGIAVCSNRDKFCKKTGRYYSLQRALSPWPKEIRTTVWDQYLKTQN